MRNGPEPSLNQSAFQSPNPDPALPIALECPICGLSARLHSGRLLDEGAIVCPLDHPLPIAEIPGLTEILTWLRDLSSAVQPNPG